MVDNALHITVTGTTSGDSWYVPYINAAVTSGLHQWSDFSSGDWSTALTRQDMVRIAVRAATADNNTDGKKWMYLASKAGLINGMDDMGTLGEDETTTRAQSVAIIERILSIKDGKTLSTDKHAVSRAEVAWHGTNIFTMMPRYFTASFIDRFEINKAQWDSGDGIYHEKGESYIAVDMEDPNDPFRSEVDGMKFDFVTFDSTGKRTNYQSLPAPSKSIVTFSRVKVVADSDFDQGLVPSVGGSITLESLGMDSDFNNWASVLSSKEGSDSILYTKIQTSQNTVDLNTENGNWELKSIFKAGTYHYVRAQVIRRETLSGRMIKSLASIICKTLLIIRSLRMEGIQRH
jgi:hypothetical protein